MSGIVICVGGVVIGFDEGEPIPERRLISIQSLGYTEP